MNDKQGTVRHLYTLAFICKLSSTSVRTRKPQTYCHNVLSRICGEIKIILKSMQDKDKAV